MSHTKGPWIAELLLFNRTDEMRFLLSTPDDEFGHMQLRNTNIYDALANARVIAAAPDLLAALEEMYAEHKYGSGSSKDWGKIATVIKKARGES